MSGKNSNSLVGFIVDLGNLNLLCFAIMLAMVEGTLQTLLAIFSGKMLEAVVALSRSGFYFGFLITVAFSLLLAFTIFFKDVCFTKYLEKAVYRIREKSASIVCGAKISWIENNHKGTLFSRVTSDINALSNSIRPVFIMGISRLVAKSFLVAYMLYTNWFLTLVVFCILPVTLGLQHIAKSAIKKCTVEKMQFMGRIVTTFSDTLGAAETVRTLSLERAMESKFKTNQNGYIEAALRENKINSLLSPLDNISRVLPHCIVLFVGGYLVSVGKMRLGDLLAFTMLAGSAIVIFSDVFSLVSKIQSLSACVDRIVDLWKTPQEVEEVGGAKQLELKGSDVAFENVCFGYKDSDEICDVSLHIMSGEFVALVGESGCGKSTIMKLMSTLYAPQKGNIYISGTNVKEMDIAALRQNISYVTQDTFLFDATIFENITCFCDDYSKQQVLDVLERVRLKDFVESLKHGLDTRIGESGSFLSGGQKQRISLARALIKNPKILLLDECTSALDEKNEREIIELLVSLPNRPTTVLITHRMSSMSKVDKVVVVKEGKVLDVGKYDELSKKHNKLFCVEVSYV